MVRPGLRTAWFAGALAVIVTPVLAGKPERVVSMNLCTDQLALMLADPGQLISVSYLAQDPDASPMATEAARLPANHGQAEEIWQLRPNLVLAGRYTTRTTVSMLERLGVPVIIFEPENDFGAIRSGLRQMGEALGQQARAAAAIRQFDAGLAALASLPGPRPRAALYSAGGYSSGTQTLSGQILAAAGYANAAQELGLTGGGLLALEALLMAEPDMIVEGRRYAGTSLAQQLLDHPALARLHQTSAHQVLSDRDWICGTPWVLRAVRRLAAARGPAH